MSPKQHGLLPIALIICLFLLSCQASTSGDLSPGEERTPSTDCMTVGQEDPPLIIRRCSGRNTYALVWPNGVSIHELGLRLAIDGTAYTSADWATASWQSSAEVAQLTLLRWMIACLVRANS